MEHQGTRKIGVVAALFISSVVASAFWEPSRSAPQDADLTTWHPNEAPANAHYVGSARCVECHKDKESQSSSLMGKASESVEECKVLRSHSSLTHRLGAYSYKIRREGNRSIYTVTDGRNTFSALILYCFGHGKGGQTYIFQRDGVYYESRVSFYPAIKGLDLTIGAPTKAPASFEEALGKRMNLADALSCFGCHTTGAATKTNLRTERLIHGITCESCHGPGDKHVAAMTAGKVEQTLILNPAGLETEEMSNFCGSCHRTWEQVVLMQQEMRRSGQELGMNSVRFQPYRITLSKCYDVSDRRISCTACHNPHRDPERDPAFYDSKCAACHTSDKELSKVGKRTAKVCRVGKQKCTTCHLPEVELPGAHTKFSDHFIRVVKPGESVW